MAEFHLAFDLLVYLYRMAEDVEKHLPAALNGNPAELLRNLVIDLNDMETFCGPDAGSYESKADDLSGHCWNAIRLDDGDVVLIRDSDDMIERCIPDRVHSAAQ